MTDGILILAFLVLCVLFAFGVLWVSTRRDREVSRHVACYEELAKQYAHSQAAASDYLLQLVTTQVRDGSILVSKLADAAGRSPYPEPKVTDDDWRKYQDGDPDATEAAQQEREEDDGHAYDGEFGSDIERIAAEAAGADAGADGEPEHIGAFGPDFARVVPLTRDAPAGEPVDGDLLRHWLKGAGLAGAPRGVAVGAGARRRPDGGLRPPVDGRRPTPVGS